MSTQAPPEPVHAAPDPPVEPASDLVPASPLVRKRRRWRFGIQSKLLMMLLATSIVSALVVGCVGYQTGKNSMQTAAFNQLTQVRDSRAHEITAFFDQLKNSLVIYTRGSTAIEAVRAFTAGFDQLQTSTISADQSAALDEFYAGKFVTDLDRTTGKTSDPLGFLQKSPAERLRDTCRPITPRPTPITPRRSSWMMPGTAAHGRPRTPGITTISGS